LDKVTIDNVDVQEVVCEKSIGTEMNDLDLTRGRLRSFQPLRRIHRLKFEYRRNRHSQRLGSKGPSIGNSLWGIEW